MPLFALCVVLAAPFVRAAETPDRPPRFEPGVEEKGFFPRAAVPATAFGDTLDRIVREAEQSHSHALLVVRDGHVLVERYFGHKRQPLYLMSVTKSIVSLAVGLLLAEHKIPSLDTPLSTWWPDWASGEKAKVTLRHVIPGAQVATVTAEKLAELAKAGFSASARLEPLVGKPFTRSERLFLEAGALLGPAERDQLAGFLEHGMRLTQVTSGAPLGFRGDGWLGQYLIVVPSARLVVVRMHAPEEGNDERENERHGFRELLDLTLALANAR